MSTQTFEFVNEDGDQESVELPVKMEVCGGCEGHGTVLCEGMRGHAYTAEEFAESFTDDEAAEYCKRGGRYDVTCPECKGRNVVAEVDEDRLTDEQRTIYAQLVESRESEAASRREDEATYRGECGYYR